MSTSRLLMYLPFAPGTTALQASTYLLSVCLFSISFLVFLNSSVSFVITDLIGLKHGVGDMVGTLGFADELVALVACPIWGILSDRLGVRWVCFLGYCIVALALVLFVQSRNVYPQLLLARLGFSVGGAATATMVTAILPSMTGGQRTSQAEIERMRYSTASSIPPNVRHSMTPSVDSEATITPERYIHTRVGGGIGHQNGHLTSKTSLKSTSNPPRLAGLVGLFTGCGALLALGIFLPLPAQFSHLKGVSQGQAVVDSFYVVAAVALLVAIACFIGLRNLAGEEEKGWATLLGKGDNYISLSTNSEEDVQGPQSAASSTLTTRFLPYHRLVLSAAFLGFNDAQIGLGYLGGFVARASSVGISLFIPLYINAYFISHGFCNAGDPSSSPEDIKQQCRAAYVLAAELTGISQLIALLCAPLFGILSDRYRRFNVPLLTASVFGIAGYTAFASVQSPEIKNVNGRGGSPVVILYVALIGISQIGAIVCSLGLLGRGVLGEEGGYNLSSQLRANSVNGDFARRSVATLTGSTLGDEAVETAPLLDGTRDQVVEGSDDPSSRSHLKGSIAGVYSLSGGAAILLLTKLGGYLFDKLSIGAPFYMMAIFNGILLVVGIGSGVYREFRMR